MMDTKDQIKAILSYYRKHNIKSPMGHSVTDGLTTCSCGAQWRTFYTRTGLEWQPLNEKCQSHDATYNELPKGKCGHTLETDGREVYCPTCG